MRDGGKQEGGHKRDSSPRDHHSREEGFLTVSFTPREKNMWGELQSALASLLDSAPCTQNRREFLRASPGVRQQPR